MFFVRVGLAAELLTDAMNRHDRLEARKMLNEILSESSGKGRFEVTYHTTPTHTTFTYVISNVARTVNDL